MDEFTSINRLRAHFLQAFGEKDQVYRVIKPYYGVGHDPALKGSDPDTIGKLREFYWDNDGKNMLSFLESPPITNNAMDTYMANNVIHEKFSGLKAVNKEDVIKETLSDDDRHSTLKKSPYNKLTSADLEHNKNKNNNKNKSPRSSVLLSPDNTIGHDVINEISDVDEEEEEEEEEDMMITKMDNDPLYSIGTFENNDNTIASYGSDKQKHGPQHKIIKNTTFPFRRMFNLNKKGQGKESYVDDDDDSTKFSFYNSGNNNPIDNFKNEYHHTKDTSTSKSKHEQTSKNFPTRNHHSGYNKAENNVRRKSVFSLKFDYDENIDEDEDDEDDEDEEDNSKTKYNFFHIDGINTITGASDIPSIQEDKIYPSNRNGADSNNSTGTNNNNSNSNNHSGNNEDNRSVNTASDSNNNISTIAGNVSRLKSHFPQLPKTTLLDGQRNTSTRSDSMSLLKSNSNENLNLNTNNYSDNNESDRYEITDIDSFINDKDLDSLDLESTDLKTDLQQNSFTEDEILEGKYDNNNMSMIPSNLISITETDFISDESSYGKSLLGSDFSRDSSMKRDSSTFLSSSLTIGSSVPRINMSSHSIPLSLEFCGACRSDDTASLNHIFDRTTSNPKTGQYISTRERKGSNISLRESMPRSVSNRRMSTASTHMSKHFINSKSRMRSTSSINNERANVSAMPEDSLTKHGNKSNPNFGKKDHHDSVKAPSKLTSDKNKDTFFPIEKTTSYLKPHKTTSQLTTLFNKKKGTSTDKSELLDYFSFVSGDKVPKNESMKLEVYIQDSKKYKKKNFETTVRKSATVFEVIGYILYLYTTKYKPDDMSKDGLILEQLVNPNNFNLNIVDEDGEPFEDNFGKLNRSEPMYSVSDNEVVLCKASSDEVTKNEIVTPVPYEMDGESEVGRERNLSFASSNNSDKYDNTLNQLSFYKSIISQPDDINDRTKKSSTIEVTVYKYPNVNPKFNYTNINVSVTSSINDILVKYCRLKSMDPNEYALKIMNENYLLDLNDTVLRLDGNYKIEIVSKKEARELQLAKMKPDLKKPKLPTIQSNDLTPLTLESISYMKKDNDTFKRVEDIRSAAVTKSKNISKHKLSSMKPNGYGGSVGNSFFKNKNTSKSSLQGPTDLFHHSNKSQGTLEYTPESSAGNNYQDIFSGAYHKYRVWRRQQMSIISKHERTLALDGDYIYIVPPEGKMHWHENVKTKSFYINQILSVKKSKKVPVNFKIYVQRGQDDVKRYYFEAVSPQECTEIVSRIHNLLTAYRMNHK
ncbi:target of rapamycin complex 2 subunit Avo1p [Monosporozyma servazzii]